MMSLIQRHKNQTELAKKIGISQSSVSALKSGVPRDCNISTCRKLIIYTAMLPDNLRITEQDVWELADAVIAQRAPPSPGSTEGDQGQGVTEQSRRSEGRPGNRTAARHSGPAMSGP